MVLVITGFVQIHVWLVMAQSDSFTDKAMHSSCFTSVLLHPSKKFKSVSSIPHMEA